MGTTAGSSGLALIIGISEGTLGGLVGAQAFFAAADHVAVWGARVKSMKLFGYPHFSSYTGSLKAPTLRCVHWLPTLRCVHRIP